MDGAVIQAADVSASVLCCFIFVVLVIKPRTLSLGGKHGAAKSVFSILFPVIFCLLTQPLAMPTGSASVLSYLRADKDQVAAKRHG